MKHSNFVPKAIAHLEMILQTVVNCAVAPDNANCLLVAVKEWVSRVCLPFVGFWREF